MSLFNYNLIRDTYTPAATMYVARERTHAHGWLGYMLDHGESVKAEDV